MTNPFSIRFENKAISPDQDFSKDEEISLIEKLVEIIPPSSYLAEFFTEQLAAYVRDNIRSDIMPNIMGSITNLQGYLSNVDYELQEALRTFEIQKRINAEITAECVVRLDDLCTSRRTIDEMRGVQADMLILVDERTTALQKAEVTIAALKIRVYNLEHPEN